MLKCQGRADSLIKYICMEKRLLKIFDKILSVLSVVMWLVLAALVSVGFFRRSWPTSWINPQAMVLGGYLVLTFTAGLMLGRGRWRLASRFWLETACVPTLILVLFEWPILPMWADAILFLVIAVTWVLGYFRLRAARRATLNPLRIATSQSKNILNLKEKP